MTGLLEVVVNLFALGVFHSVVFGARGNIHELPFIASLLQIFDVFLESWPL
jgi:hypothetical protein